MHFVTSGRLPKNAALRARCIVNPDRLADLAQRFRAMGPSEDLVDQFSFALHDLRMGGAYKRTNRGRLGETVRMLCAHVRPQFRHDLTLLDIGASDGITTVEAVRTLRQNLGGEVRAFVADLNICLLRYKRAQIVEYRAANGEPIMARCGPVGVLLARHRHNVEQSDGPIAAFYLKQEGFRKAMTLDARISLVNPLAHAEPGVTVLQFDCLARSPDLVDRISAVRASNVLNLDYFARGQIEGAIANLHAYLRPEGCLVISRNGDQAAGEVENGSVWLKDNGRFTWAEDFGAGSEVKTVVDAWRAPGTEPR